jgi:hypothetical protein
MVMITDQHELVYVSKEQIASIHPSLAAPTPPSDYDKHAKVYTVHILEHAVCRINRPNWT